MKAERTSRKGKIGDRKGYLAVLVNPRKVVPYTNPSVLNLLSMNNPPSNIKSMTAQPPTEISQTNNLFPPNFPGINPKFQSQNLPPQNNIGNFLPSLNPILRENPLGIPPSLIRPPIINPLPQLAPNKNFGGNIPKIFQNPNPNPPTRPNNLLETLSSILKSSPHQEESLKEDFEDQQIWSGFFTRSKKNRVGVDALHVWGDEIQINDFNLNISFRISFDEILKKKHCSIVLFVPSNETQISIFQEYISYFKEKVRAGVIPLRNHTLYLLPPCEESKKYHQLRENQLLGVIVKASDDKQVSAMSGNIDANPINENKFGNTNSNQNESDFSDLKPLLENEEFMNILNNIKY